MLVLSRKQGEKIKIGDGTIITVLSISPQKVSLGITAAKDVKIFRTELIGNGQDQENSQDHERNEDDSEECEVQEEHLAISEVIKSLQIDPTDLTSNRMN